MGECQNKTKKLMGPRKSTWSGARAGREDFCFHLNCYITLTSFQTLWFYSLQIWFVTGICLRGRDGNPSRNVSPRITAAVEASWVWCEHSHSDLTWACTLRWARRESVCSFRHWVNSWSRSITHAHISVFSGYTSASLLEHFGDDYAVWKKSQKN